MRRLTLAALMALAAALSFAYDDVAVSGQAAQADAAPLERQPELYIKIAERQMKEADRLYTSGKVDEATAAVRDVVTYSEKATDTAARSGKRLKQTEISIRKMSKRLHDIQRTLSYDDQGPVKTATDRLEELRTQLLDRMFSKDKKR